MEDMTQFNIRISKKLLYDLEYVATHYNINRNEWLRVEIAKLITHERQAIQEEIERRYIQGKISDIDFRKEMGFEPTPEMKELKGSATKAAMRFFNDALKGVEPETRRKQQAKEDTMNFIDELEERAKNKKKK